MMILHSKQDKLHALLIQAYYRLDDDLDVDDASILKTKLKYNHLDLNAMEGLINHYLLELEYNDIKH